MQENLAEESKVSRQKKSKSQYRAPRPPLPAAKQPPVEKQESRRVGNIRAKRVQGEYNTDVDTAKRQSRIPRLSQASEERVPKPKKYVPGSEYKSEDPPEPRKVGMRRSQSYLSQKKLPQKPSSEPVDLRKMSKNMNPVPKPEYAGGAGSRRSVNYKPRTLREYKEMIEKEDPFTYKVRGGLGANIGGDEWQKQNEKRQRMKEFANRVKQNKNTSFGDPMRRTSQSTAVETQEK